MHKDPERTVQWVRCPSQPDQWLEARAVG